MTRSAPKRRLVLGLLLAALALTSSLRAGRSLPLHLTARVPLSGPAVRFDYASFDPTTNRLWIAHMDADELLAFDVVHRRIVKTVAAPGVHGVIAVPELGRVYASATNAREVLTLNARTGAVLARAPAGQYPDGLAYDPVERHVFVSDESGGVETVLNVAGRRIATISLGGEAGNVQYDSGSGRVLADVQTLNQVAVIDPRTNRIERRVHLAKCVNDHSLLVDSARRLGFIACDGNATLATLDLRTMRVTGTFKVGSSPDVLASTARCAGSTSRPRAASSQSSPRQRIQCGRSGWRSSPRRLTPSLSTKLRTWSTSRFRAARPASRSY